MVDGVASCDPISFNSSDYECRERSINETNFWSEDFCPKTSVSWMPVVGMMLYLATVSVEMEIYNLALIQKVDVIFILMKTLFRPTFYNLKFKS